MKFLIIAFHPRSMTPYAKQYEDAILKAGYGYDILFWDRFSNAPLEKRDNECECQPKSEPLAHEFLSHSCS